MAEAAVFGLLSNFAPNLREELNLLSGVREDIEYIRGEFERMTHFLRVADAIEDRDPKIKAWVKQVREAAYDTADALDTYILRLRHHRNTGFREFVHKVSFFINTLKARHQIATEVKGIKSRIINISEGHQRYGDIHGKIEQGSSSTPSNIAWYDYRGDALLLQDADLVGINKPKSHLIQWLVDEDPRLKVLSVAGMGGLGKTTLTKKVYDDATVKRHFQNHVWITVSESFKVEELLKDMIRVLFEEVRLPLPRGLDNMYANSLKGIINSFLQQKRLQKEDGTVLCSSLKKLNNLHSLSVAAIGEDEIIDLDSLSLPPRLLQKLHLKGRLEKIPHWIPTLHNLRKLKLGWSKLKDVDPLDSLQDLPNLLHLQLTTAYEGDGLFFKVGGFQKLKHLWLVRLGRLKWVRVESSSMPLLEKLYLLDCKLMMELPSGVEYLANLKYLNLSDMSETLISSLNRDLQGGDYWKIAHVPKVWIGKDSKSGYFIGRYL
ncbi:hypothetical protein RHMOL_Rhmol02G0111400 [Rhododendron molle]|uniref:Uncharacterized protein n=1 Tax=Rhododendron molle TaxID=49168 RepID=A0ACC0PRK0_RHOML|nr:hypothetical protein RHMOL_Rhmol02G0111400 [Rhododendron molle]